MAPKKPPPFVVGGGGGCAIPFELRFMFISQRSLNVLRKINQINKTRFDTMIIMRVNQTKNRLTYPLKKRQIDLLFSTLAYSATDHVDLKAKRKTQKNFFSKREKEDVMQIIVDLPTRFVFID